MRVLRFIVDENMIVRDPSCNFDGLFPGTEKFVKMEFTFSPEWIGAVKVAAFWSALGNEYPPQVLDENDSCMVPEEALMYPAFKVQILGRRAKTMFKTNNITVFQKGGKL